jgi:hypothetical protein
MTTDNGAVPRENGNLPSTRHDRQKHVPVTKRSMKRKLTAAERADMLEAALARNSDRWQTKLSQLATRPSSDVAVSCTSGCIRGDEPTLHHETRAAGDGHARVMWHSAF